MKSSRWSAAWGLLLLAFASSAPTGAQQDTCADLVEQALTTTNARCSATGRDQVCYGNEAVQAEPQPSFGGRFTFARVGDRVNAGEVQTLRLSGADLDAGEWGMALMRLKANLSDEAQDEYVTLLLFGDVEVTNAIDYADLPPRLIEVNPLRGVNVRGGPSTNAEVVAGLRAGQLVIADGRLADGSWIRIRLPDTEQERGWVFANLIGSAANLNALKVVDPSAPPEPFEVEGPGYGPMQTFYFKAGQETPPCPEAGSGLLIQTPGSGQDAILVVNDVTLQIASTVYLEMQTPSEMTINVIEGGAMVTASDVTHIVPAGARLRVPLDTDLSASVPLEAPEPYDAGALAALPLGGLAREVTVAPALTQAEIDALNIAPKAGEWQVTLSAEALSCTGSRERYPPFPEEPYPATVRIEAGGARLVWGQTPYTRIQPGVYEALGSFAFRGATITYASTVRVVEDEQLQAEIVLTTEDGCTLTQAAEVEYSAGGS